MFRKFSIIIIATALASTSVLASQPQQPRLVVGIVVEGLNQGDIETFGNDFANNGIRYFQNNGITLSNVTYPSESYRETATAILFTGTSPAVNGITGTTVYNREAMRHNSVVNDPKFMGNFTSETYSPSALKVSTIADEIRIANNGKSHVYSIAADAPTAIITAGHAGNSAVWINDRDGKWSTTTYYKELPQIVSTRNYKQPLTTRLDTITWSGGALVDGVKPFKYYFPKKDVDRYAAFKVSPRGNDEITSLALDYIDNVVAKDPSATDMLTVGYTVAEYPYGRSTSTRYYEREDAYRRLDSQIARLLAAIDKKVGLQNAVVYLAGVPVDDFERPVEYTSWTMPYGEFSPRRAQALLNLHLTSLYGNGEWVTGYHRYHFYLNNKLGRERGLTNEQLHEAAAEFLRRMSGVCEAVTIEEHIRRDTDRQTDVSTAGDVVISVTPGWTLVETNDINTEGKCVRMSASVAPIYILAPQYKPVTITSPVEARSIAPTLSHIINIRAPNASTLAPISLERH